MLRKLGMGRMRNCPKSWLNSKEEILMVIFCLPNTATRKIVGAESKKGLYLR